MTFEEIEATIRAELRDYFQTEFLNRIDHSIVFAPLTEKQVEKIVDKEFSEVCSRLQERSIQARLQPAVRSHIARTSFSPEHGARLVRKTVSELVENALADAIVDGTIRSGDAVTVTMDKKVVKIVKSKKKKSVKKSVTT